MSRPTGNLKLPANVPANTPDAPPRRYTLAEKVTAVTKLECLSEMEVRKCVLALMDYWDKATGFPPREKT